MPDALRRVSVHCVPDDDEPVTVDLALPASMRIGELIPSIVDACGAPANHWRLCPVGGPPLDESMTLAQKAVHDGDVLLLTAGPVPTPAQRPGSVDAALTATAAPRNEVPAAGCFWLFVIGALTVVWSGIGTSGAGRLVTSALLAAAAVTAAVVAPRWQPSPAVAATLNITAIVQLAALGFLAVPAGPGPANVFLAAIVAASTATVLVRVSDCSTALLLAALAFSAAVGVAAGCAVIHPLGLQPFGAVLVATAIGVLSLTPRLSIIIAGLTPPVPGTGPDEPDRPEGGTDRAEQGHRALTGMVTGCATAATVGVLLVALGGRHSVTPAAIAFTAVTGVALVLRARSHASGWCRHALSVAGLLSLTATFTLIALWAPQHGSWIGLFAVGTGVALLMPRTSPGLAATRIVDCAEYLALTAVAPLACWLAGAFDMIGGWW